MAHEVAPAALRPEEAAPTFRQRWLSGRALVLHLGVLLLAPGCALAGWWQATRALAGNGLSWAYSVEWPGFALLAVAGWWHLVHESPEAYRARKSENVGVLDLTGSGPAAPPGPVASQLAPGRLTAAQLAPPAGEAPRVTDAITRLSTWMAGLVGLEFVLGIASVLSVPLGRGAGWLPPRGQAVYLAHFAAGAVLAAAGAGFVHKNRAEPRFSRAVAWSGLAGLALAGAGGLLTEAPSLVRFLGMVLMFLGPAVAGFAYMVPALLRSSQKASLAS